MSKITNDGLTRSGKGFTQIATVGVKGLKLLVPPLSHPMPPFEPPQLQKCRTATDDAAQCPVFYHVFTVSWNISVHWKTYCVVVALWSRIHIRSAHSVTSQQRVLVYKEYVFDAASWYYIYRRRDVMYTSGDSCAQSHKTRSIKAIFSPC